MGKVVYYFGTAVWVGGLLMIIGNVTGVFPTFPFAGFIVTVIGILIQVAGNAIMKREAESNPVIHKVAQLLADPRYQAAQQLVMEDIKNKVPGEQLLDRGIAYLEQQGIPKAEAVENLNLVLAVLVVGAKE
jgi:hypothetical protein